MNRPNGNRVRTLWVGLCFLGAAAGLVGCGPQAPFRDAGLVLHVREIRLGAADVDTPVLEFAVSPDGGRAAWIERRGGRQVVVTDGLRPHAHEQAVGLTFNADGTRLAWAGRNAGAWRLYMDGWAGPACTGLETPVFSPDGRRVAVGVRREGDLMDPERFPATLRSPFEADYDTRLYEPPPRQQAEFAFAQADRVVVDGLEGKAYDSIWGEPVFSPDSRHVAYVVRESDARLPPDGPFVDPGRVVLDGKEGAPFDDVQHLVFSPDSSHLAYTAAVKGPDMESFERALTGKGPAGPPDSFVVADGKPGKRYHGVGEPVFSPDSRHLAYGAILQEGQCVVLDGRELKTYRRVNTIAFSPDSSRLAYVATRPTEDAEPLMPWPGGRQCVVVDGREGRLYDRIWGPPRFSPDSQRVAYFASQDDADGEFVVIDGKEYGPYNIWDHELCAPVFSPDSEHVAFCAVRPRPEYWGPEPPDEHRWLVVVDGVEHGPYDMVLKGTPRFSPDGRHLMWVAFRDGKAWIVVDGVKGAIYDQVLWPAFSPDGRHLAYWARRGKVWRIVVDGVETNGEGYDGYIRDSRIVFDGPARLHALAYRRPEIIRVDVRIDDARNSVSADPDAAIRE